MRKLEITDQIRCIVCVSGVHLPLWRSVLCKRDMQGKRISRATSVTVGIHRSSSRCSPSPAVGDDKFVALQIRKRAAGGRRKSREGQHPISHSQIASPRAATNSPGRRRPPPAPLLAARLIQKESPAHLTTDFSHLTISSWLRALCLRLPRDAA